MNEWMNEKFIIVSHTTFISDNNEMVWIVGKAVQGYLNVKNTHIEIKFDCIVFE